MKAKVTFSFDGKNYSKGGYVPSDVAKRYPNLVEGKEEPEEGNAEPEKVEVIQEKEKKEVKISTKKVKK